ncbi:MAG: hypothetical protein KME46_13805 [Brasilonema angustatum HA4187-MV1]|jgi:hypothetical protein|nr:hypothetical protein [Brasilonema angustatum HA4187-MV1]
MESIKVEDLDNEPISFDLTEEDLQSIKGGSTTTDKISNGEKTHFPIRIVAIPPKRPFQILIVAIPKSS